jgi:hypothetical protein
MSKAGLNVNLHHLGIASPEIILPDFLLKKTVIIFIFPMPVPGPTAP